MEKYALLGTYKDSTRSNIEIIALSNNRRELINIWNAIIALQKELEFSDRDLGEGVQDIIDGPLASINIVDEDTNYVHEIEVSGVFEISGFNTTMCNRCSKILFVGTDEEARRLIIYCTECP